MSRSKDETELGSLHCITRKLLIEFDATTFDVAAATGLTYSWLVSFASDRMRNPSVNKVQKLYEYLTGKQLKLAR
jgi:hypothetical protein